MSKKILIDFVEKFRIPVSYKLLQKLILFGIPIVSLLSLGAAFFKNDTSHWNPDNIKNAGYHEYGASKGDRELCVIC